MNPLLIEEINNLMVYLPEEQLQALLEDIQKYVQDNPELVRSTQLTKKIFEEDNDLLKRLAQ